MSKNLLVAALTAFALSESDVLASAERDGCMVVVTTAGQKLVYDPKNPPVQAETLADTPKEGAGALVPAPTEGTNTSTAEGQVEVDVSAAAGEAAASPAGSADASTEAAATAEAKAAAPAGAKSKKAGAK